MIYVTHDQLEAMTMSDRIAVMQGGVLQQFATPDEVYSRPVNRFVAGFIGTPSMNLIEGTLSRSDTGAVFSSRALTVAIDQDSLANGVLEMEGSLAITLGFRPDDIIFSEEGEEARVRGR